MPREESMAMRREVLSLGAMAEAAMFAPVLPELKRVYSSNRLVTLCLSKSLSWQKGWGYPGDAPTSGAELKTAELGEEASRPRTHTASHRKEIHQLKRLLVE